MANEKVKRTILVSLIVIFVLIISAPLIFINRDSEKTSMIENKKLALFPKFTNNDGILNYSFLSEFETYINDNIGFKQEAVVCDIALASKIFNKVKVPSIIMGEEDNVFYTSGGTDILTFQGKNLLSEEQLVNVSQGFSYMQNYFENSGANFYIVTIPNKENVYPELYSKGVKQLSTKSRIDILDEYIHENTNVNILNVKQALLDNKQNDMLYFKSFDYSHWNMNGAFVGYTEIMNMLKKNYPDLDILKKDQFDISIEKSKGSLMQFSNIEIVNKAMSFDDEIFGYNLKNGYGAVFTHEIPAGLEININDKFFHAVNSNKSDMPKILIIGDSFMYNFLLSMLAESFSELYFVNYTSAQKLMDIQELINADIILYEFVERAFSEEIYKELNNFNIVKIEDTIISEVSIIDETPVFYIDYPTVNNNEIIIDKNQVKQKIYGWAIDSSADALVGDIFLKVGDNYYKPQYFERPDLGKDKFLMAGYQFEVSTKELIEEGSIEFIILSNDKTYKYKPVEVNIKSN